MPPSSALMYFSAACAPAVEPGRPTEPWSTVAKPTFTSDLLGSAEVGAPLALVAVGAAVVAVPPAAVVAAPVVAAPVVAAGAAAVVAAPDDELLLSLPHAAAMTTSAAPIAA